MTPDELEDKEDEIEDKEDEELDGNSPGPLSRLELLNEELLLKEELLFNEEKLLFKDDALEGNSPAPPSRLELLLDVADVIALDIDITALDADAIWLEDPLEGNSPPPEEDRAEEIADDVSNSVSAGNPLSFPPPHPLNTALTLNKNINAIFFMVATLPWNNQ